jgi:hypothetical protein
MYPQLKSASEGERPQQWRNHFALLRNANESRFSCDFLGEKIVVEVWTSPKPRRCWKYLPYGWPLVKATTQRCHRRRLCVSTLCKRKVQHSVVRLFPTPL